MARTRDDDENVNEPNAAGNQDQSSGGGEDPNRDRSKQSDRQDPDKPIGDENDDDEFEDAEDEDEELEEDEQEPESQT